MTEIATRIQQVRQQISHACTKSGRSDQSVQLLAVSKTYPAAAVMEAYATGQRHFGENYLQDALQKIDTLKDYTDLVWHFIGPLQSNKTKAVAENFHWMHSLDRLKIAKRLSEQRGQRNPLNVCIQVNISQDSNKAGVPAQEVIQFAQSIQGLPGICLRGLMTIPANHDNVADIRADFAAMKRLFEQLKAQYASIDTLSMGMSGDLELAIMEGSTQVRIGTAIFGPRQVLR